MNIIDIAQYPELVKHASILGSVHYIMRQKGFESYQLGPYTTNDVVDALRREVKELREWKRQQMLVESQWDEQEVGRELGMAIGTPIRENILPLLRQLKLDADAYRNMIENP